MLILSSVRLRNVYECPVGWELPAGTRNMKKHTWKYIKKGLNYLQIFVFFKADRLILLSLTVWMYIHILCSMIIIMSNACKKIYIKYNVMSRMRNILLKIFQDKKSIFKKSLFSLLRLHNPYLNKPNLKMNKKFKDRIRLWKFTWDYKTVDEVISEILMI